MSDSVYCLLLINDKEERELIGKTLSALGVSFKVAASPKECWDLMDQFKELHFLFLDVRLISSEQVSLSEHPLLKESKLPVFLFSMKSDFALLKTSQMLPVYDYIEESPSYRKQLSASLKKLAERIQLQRKIKTLENKSQQLGSAYQNLKKEIQSQQVKVVREKNILDFMTFFWREKSKGSSFFNCFSEGLKSLGAVSKGYFFSLNDEKNKIFCQDFGLDFLEILPVLNLESSVESISKAARESCVYVASKSLGGKAKSILISKVAGQVDYVFVYQDKNNCLPEEEFSNFLNSEYRGILGHAPQSLDPWDFVQSMNSFRGKVVKINFEKLTHEIARENYRFLGRQFKVDLLNGLSLCFKDQVQFCFIGTSTIYVIGDHDKLLAITDRYVKNIKYWNYFEDSSNSFTKMVTPVVEDYSSNLEFLRSELFNKNAQRPEVYSLEVNA